jgi:glycosyltransferase involved in cell wall biosynthesis
MNVWLVTIGEPLPHPGTKNPRLLRTGILAGMLADHGHRVVWWTSTYDHSHKKSIAEDGSSIRGRGDVEIRLFSGYPYKKNVSISRVKNHVQVANKIATAFQLDAHSPDIIVCSYPILELCTASLDYARPRGIPVIIDVRDLWPDIFMDHVPIPFRFFLKFALRPMLRTSHRIFREATSITGITEDFVTWALQRGQRQKSSWDLAFPMGYSSIPPSPENLARADQFWNEQGLSENHEKTIACFIGTIGKQFDLSTVIAAFQILNQRTDRLKLVLAGTGEHLATFVHQARHFPNIIFPGWIDSAQIYSLLRRSSFGIDPLPDRFDFRLTINNKAIEYLSAGLVLLTSPDRGTLHELITKENCGLSYPPGGAQALAGAIESLISDGKRKKTMADNASSLFQRMFAAERVYDGMITHMENLVDSVGV